MRDFTELNNASLDENHIKIAMSNLSCLLT
jgi:hypothetical protein